MTCLGAELSSLKIHSIVSLDPVSKPDFGLHICTCILTITELWMESAHFKAIE